MVFAWIAESIGQAAFALGGKEKGQQTRAVTQLYTEKMTSLLIMTIPLVLLAFCRFLTPNVFRFANFYCMNAKWYDTYASVEVYNEKNVNCTGGCSISESSLFNGPNNRHYHNSWCWNRLQDYPFGLGFKQNDPSSSTLTPIHTSVSNSPNSDLSFHQFFPYFLLIVTAIASTPLIIWTYFADERIKPEVTFFREALEALAKAFILNRKLRKVQKQNLETVVKELDNVTKDKAEEKPSAAAAIAAVVADVLPSNRDDHVEEAEEVANDNGDNGVVEIEDNETEEQKTPAPAPMNVPKEEPISQGQVTFDPKKEEPAADTKPEDLPPPTKQEMNQYSEKIVCQFSSLINFMEAKSKTNSLLRYIYIYRFLNIFAILTTIYLLVTKSLSATQNTFTCKVDYNDALTYYQICSINGVGMRILISQAWILGYLACLVLIVAGTMTDLKKMSLDPEYQQILKLFNAIYPADIDVEDKKPNDLKLLMMLASQNLQSNKFVKTIFTLLSYAELSIEIDNNKYVKRLKNISEMNNQQEQATQNTNKNQVSEEFNKDIQIQFKFLDLLDDMRDNDNADIQKLLLSLDS